MTAASNLYNESLLYRLEVHNQEHNCLGLSCCLYYEQLYSSPSDRTTLQKEKETKLNAIL